MSPLLGFSEDTIAKFLFLCQHGWISGTKSEDYTIISKSLNPPGPAYCCMVAALAAILDTDVQLFWISSDMRHELPTFPPHVHTSSLPHWQMENRIGFAVLSKASRMVG